MQMNKQGSKYGGRQQQKPEFFEIERVFHLKKNKKFECKKNKGEHTWEHTKSTKGWFPKGSIWRHYRCSSCNKHGHEFGNNLHKRFDQARRDDKMVITDR